MSTPKESINTNFCLQWSKEAPTLYKDQIFFFKNWPRNNKKLYMTKCHACMHVCACTHTHTHTSETQESSCDTETYNKYMAKEEQQN